MIRSRSLHALALLAASFCAPRLLHAQPAATKPDATTPAAKPAQDLSKSCPDCPTRRHDDGTWPTHTFYLKYATSQNEVNEIASTLRTLLPAPDMTFVVASQSAIIVHASPDDIALAQKLLDDLDRPEKSWRLTYTLTELDGDKRVGTQHYSMDVVANQQTTLKQGSRVPIATGYISSASPNASTQNAISYQDVGVTFDAVLAPQADGANLKSSIELTSAAASAVSSTNPIIRQSALKGTDLLTPNKPLILGAMDVPDSTHNLQIEFLMEPLP
jgi:type II secretory pathway component GspD/PulD (secretin)